MSVKIIFCILVLSPFIFYTIYDTVCERKERKRRKDRELKERIKFYKELYEYEQVWKKCEERKKEIKIKENCENYKQPDWIIYSDGTIYPFI